MVDLVGESRLLGVDATCCKGFGFKSWHGGGEVRPGLALELLRLGEHNMKKMILGKSDMLLATSENVAA
jgi:hypothetical protein